MAKRRILHELVLNKISAVDYPCQEGALALIMKRDDSVCPDCGKPLAGCECERDEAMSKLQSNVSITALKMKIANLQNRMRVSK